MGWTRAREKKNKNEDRENDDGGEEQ